MVVVSNRCSKCGGIGYPTPESDYQDYKCSRCGNKWGYQYAKKYTSDGTWGHGIG